MKELHTYSDFQKDTIKIEDYIKENNINHIVGIYRGSLPLSVALSNRCNIPLSIIDFQTRDGNSKGPVLIKKVKDIDENTLIIDDIYDSGKTLNTIYEKFPKAKYLTLYKKVSTKPAIPLTYLRETDKWIVFEVWE